MNDNMMNVLEVSRRYRDQWVVLDGRQAVLDHGPELKPLWDKHNGQRKRTFYFAAGMRP